MAAPAPVTATTTLEDVEVECTHCRVKMSTHLGSGTTVRYFNCPSCHRWVSSAYTEVFRADAKVRPHRPQASKSAFEEVKGRLDRWLAAVEDQDPYRTLGVSPMDAAQRIREVYLQLALANHPDRGGSPERMRQINEAYEKIHFHRERRKAEQLEAGAAADQLGSGV